MRTFLSGLSALLCGFLLIGAMGLNAPIMQSQSYYINDHAGVIERENRDEMLERAQELYESTGVRVVLLTIEDLDGRTPEEYAELIFRAWELGTEGDGVLILLSTEEKRFAVWPNDDASVLDSAAAADPVADAGKFDLASSMCFSYIVDKMYIKYPYEEREKLEVSKSEAVNSESTVTDKQESHNTQVTKDTQSTTSTNISEMQKIVFFAALCLLFFFFFMRAARKKPRRSKKYEQSEAYYRKIADTGDTWLTARTDDLDYPTGFGGLGNRKAIYLEDVDAADDIGIIKRNNSGVFKPEEQNSKIQ